MNDRTDFIDGFARDPKLHLGAALHKGSLTVLTLNLAQRLGAATKALRFHPKLMQHGEIEIGKGQLGVSHFSLPTRVVGDAGGGLVGAVVGAVVPMFKAHVATTEEQQWSIMTFLFF